MASVRFTDVQARPTEFLDFTSLTLDEFQQLVPPFEAAFQAHMAAWRLDGKPRTARRFTVYKNCPLPTPEDRLFFILVSLKTSALQVVQGRLFGMGQSKAHQWIHVLLPALLAALRSLGDAPARSLTALAQRLGVSEADAATVVAPLEEEPALIPAPASPLLPMTGRNGASSAPKTLLHSKRVITPPQSGGLAGCEQPLGLPGLAVTWLELTWLLCPLGVKLLLLLDRGTHLRFLKTDGGHRVPSCPEAFTMKVSLPSTQLSSDGDGTRPFDRANHLGHRIRWRHPDAQVAMVLHHRPCHDGTPPLPGQLTQHRTKQWPHLAIQRFLAPL
jgi:Helix-turn-helix of DDE superfamily endonuclease